MRKFTIALAAIALAMSGAAAWADSQGSATGGTSGTQSTLSGCRYNSSPATLSSGQQTGLNCTNTGDLKVNASVSASVTPFAPNGNIATLAVTSTTGNVALPAGAAVLISNSGSKTAYVHLSVGAGTATTTDLAVPGGGAVGLAVGSNTYVNAITGGSDTTTINIAGGAGLVAGYGGGGGGGSSSTVAISQTGTDNNVKVITGSTTAVTQATGTNLHAVIDSGTITAVTAITNALPAGTNSIGTIVTNGDGSSTGGTAGTKSLLGGGLYNTSVPTLTNGQQAAFQLDSSGNLLVKVQSAGYGQGLTTSTQNLSPIGCRTLSSAPTDTTATTNIPRCTTSGELAVSVTSGSAGNGAASNTGSAVPTQGDYGAVNIGGTLRGQTGVNPSGTVYAAQTDLTSVGGTTYALGQTTMSTSMPVTIASNQSALSTTPTPATSGGLSLKRLLVANNTTSVAVDASAGQLYGIEAFNNSATIAYVKLYNTAQGSTTCGSGTVIYSGMIPANSTSGAGYISMNLYGLPFSTAITACVTTGYADADTTAPAASAYLINFFYK